MAVHKRTLIAVHFFHSSLPSSSVLRTNFMAFNKVLLDLSHCPLACSEYNSHFYHIVKPEEFEKFSNFNRGIPLSECNESSSRKLREILATWLYGKANRKWLYSSRRTGIFSDSVDEHRDLTMSINTLSHGCVDWIHLPSGGLGKLFLTSWQMPQL